MQFCITSRRTSEMYPGWSESEEERLLARQNDIKMYLIHWIYRTITGCHEHDREPSDSMKYRKVFGLPKRLKFLGGRLFCVLDT